MIGAAAVDGCPQGIWSVNWHCQSGRVRTRASGVVVAVFMKSEWEDNLGGV